MKFLMIYVNDTGKTRVPVGIFYILNLVQEKGHEISLFDTTKYAIGLEVNDFIVRADYLNFQAVDLEPYGVSFEKSNMEQIELDLSHRIIKFSPDLVGVSIMEDTSETGLHLARVVKSVAPSIPLIMGGVYCFTRPEAVIDCESVDIVCVGEGEIAVVELLNRMSEGKDIRDIPNLWIKLPDGTIVKNQVGPPVDLNMLPYTDISLVSDRHLYSPFAGHVYKTSFVEGQRGCPRRCAYCCNQLFLDAYSKYGSQYLRRKSVRRLIDELIYLKEEFGLNFFQFTDDDFLLRHLEELTLFSRLYKKHIDFPFWIQAEARNVTDEKIKAVRDAGCISISIGIESGSERILKNVMNRNTPRELTLKAFKVMHEYGIRSSANVIIGLPDETRDDIFQTVELVRECEPKSSNTSIFIPYYGTKLWQYSVEKKYLNPEYRRSYRDSWKAVLDMPHISKKEIEDIARTFMFYSTLPKKTWPEIEKVEKFPADNLDLRVELENIYWEIMLKRGINVNVPGFDYDNFLKQRQKELTENKE